MNNKEIVAACALGYVVVTVVIAWLIARNRPLDTIEERIARATDAPAAPPERIGTADSSYVDPDSPPVLLNRIVATDRGPVRAGCKRVLLILKCDDPLMWYANLIDKQVPYLGEWKSEGRYKSREPAGYINVVKFGDARVIVVPV